MAADKNFFKYQVNTWVYFKGPNNQYYQGLIKEYDYKDYLYKIEYINDNGFVKYGYVFEREILDFKFKSGEEIQFRCFSAWKRGKICSSYADRDGRIFYDINPWDEMIKAYDSLRGYKEIQEMDVRKIPLECKFKEGDKIIFKTSSGRYVDGTIIKVCHEARIPWDYDVIEKDNGEHWNVFENSITGMWDDCNIHVPYNGLYDALKNFSNRVLEKTVKLDYEPDYFTKVFGKPWDTDSAEMDWKSWYPKANDPIANYLREKENKKMKKKDRPRDHKFVKTENKYRKIKEVIFNGPATIIKWDSTIDENGNYSKGDKTVSVCGKNDIYDREKGFLLAVIKEFVDNQSYDNILRMIDSFNDEERK